MVDKYADKINGLYKDYNIPQIYPVPLLEIVEALGYRAGYFIVNADNEDLAGATYYKEKRIFVSPIEFGGRYKFTLAHEIGHIVLGHDRDNEREYDTRAEIVAPEYKTREYEANEFAAELLMPAEKFKEVWENRKNTLELANFFDVTHAAAKVRMERLGIRYE